MFKPILCPNDTVDLNDIKYPLMASHKLDGIRCIFKQGEMLSRSLKQIPNIQLKEKFNSIINYTMKHNLILEGEFYSHDLTFQEITSVVMTQDKEVPESLKFNCFDCLEQYLGKAFTVDTYNINTPFIKRIKLASIIQESFKDIMTVLKQEIINSEDEVTAFFEKALQEGYEGLILRNPEGKYKFGRCTIKEANLYKVKPFRTFDGKIIEITQGTEVNPEAEKKINELGRSVTSKKKADRMLIDRVRDFVVEYEGHILKVASSSLTHEERERLWKIRDSLIGQWIDYKGMLVGSKDVPRHPVFIRFREPKE